ncbi:hypothetical protein CROQUDRAFT_130942 [Cronartium quercuum f. sp. fusiforme G11]|uniref:Uncharacterized protein n=1 Tax=Cronartium quercuum f. sp. fusiforme G11 TaxID=708437 RepID=A0A9P6NTJ3_9BASI|nr:hypothetical protein CROQUDRAFT_130942 [Cronartium quercuum f. sp. fusiforme G11]
MWVEAKGDGMGESVLTDQPKKTEVVTEGPDARRSVSKATGGMRRPGWMVWRRAEGKTGLCELTSERGDQQGRNDAQDWEEKYKSGKGEDWITKRYPARLYHNNLAQTRSQSGTDKNDPTEVVRARHSAFLIKKYRGRSNANGRGHGYVAHCEAKAKDETC